MNEKKSKAQTALSLLSVVAGNALYALTVTLFLLPSGLVTGGTTGMALTINYLFGIQISGFVLIFNVAMLILGFFILGKTFAFTTLASTFLYPFFLEFFEKLVGNYQLTDDLLLCTIFTGLGIGISLGIVIRSGASTGGMDIPPLVLQKTLHIPVSVSMYAFDVCILFSQAIFRPAENILYGIVLVMIYTMVLDKMLMLGTSKTELKVVSKKADDIRQTILNDIDRGVTILEAKGGFSNASTEVVLSVISNRELPRVKKLIQKIDPESFIIISHVSEVRGRGFSLNKKYK